MQISFLVEIESYKIILVKIYQYQTKCDTAVTLSVKANKKVNGYIIQRGILSPAGPFLYQLSSR